MTVVKQKYSDLTARIFLSVIAVILVGIMITYVKFFIDGTTDTAQDVIGSTQEISEDYSNYEIIKYDGEEIRGSEVVNFIKKHLGDYTLSETAPIYTEVTTVTSGTTYSNTYDNKEHLSDIKNFSSLSYYIKPTAMFTCNVIMSTNKAILGIQFIQK